MRVKIIEIIKIKEKLGKYSKVKAFGTTHGRYLTDRYIV